MSDVLERIWKEEFVLYFKILSQNLPGGTTEDHDEPQ
jgi:hypothetical protein